MIVKLIFLTGFFIVLIAIQFKSLRENKNLKDVLVYSVFMLLAAIYSYAYLLDFTLPNPTKLMRVVYEPLTDLVIDALAGE